MPTSCTIPDIPLAERVRPLTPGDFFGQEHLMAPHKPLRLMYDNDRITSFILWGSPGTGKTTIARMLALKTNAEFHKLNAVSSGVKDIREVIQQAEAAKEHGKNTVLFIDEIHRFNKAQQDALLGAVEAGTIILIGATTENPSFEVIPALRSRVRIFHLEELTEKDVISIVQRALAIDDFLKALPITEVDFDFLVYVAGGDARSALNILEAAVLHQLDLEAIKINKDAIEETVQKKNIIYDKNGEGHYNLISAFIKSIRGSDPDAALYWMGRMIAGGEDPIFIARRMVILASEDIGNASPNALVLAVSCFQALERIGMPEGLLVMAQCATYLASSPKSNASYKGIKAAMKTIENEPQYPVPLHLRNAPTALMKGMGYGKNYQYPHDAPGNFSTQQYLPDEIAGKQFYYPTENGLEKGFRDRLKIIWKDKKKY